MPKKKTDTEKKPASPKTEKPAAKKTAAKSVKKAPTAVAPVPVSASPAESSAQTSTATGERLKLNLPKKPARVKREPAAEKNAPAKLPTGKVAPVKLPSEKVVAKSVTISTGDISLRAYFIAENRKRHGLPGDETSDWIEAERQLLSELVEV